MQKKKRFALLMCAAMACVALVGGTMAYLTYSDSDVNVMTLGNVKIEQIEEQRVDDSDNQHGLTGFDQDKKLLPAYYPGDSIPWADEDEWVEAGNQAWKVVEDNDNVIDKFVRVKNNGSESAYVRTVFAVEVGPDAVNDSYVHVVNNAGNVTEGATWEWEWLDGVAEINGNYYALAVATYSAELPAGYTTIPSLKQIYMDKNATNEIVAKYGDTYEILAFSQAVQSDMDELTPVEALNEAFGEISTTNHPWLDVAIVDNAEELSAALAEGKDVALASDLELEDEPITIANGAEITLDLNGFKLAGIATNDSTSKLIDVQAGATLTIKDGTVSFYATTPDTNWGGEGQPPYPGYANNTISNYGTLIIDGATIENLTAHGGASYAIDCYQGSELIVNSGKIDGQGKCAIRMFCNSNTLSTDVTINGGTITGKRAIWVQLPGSNINNVRPVNLTINGGELICTNTDADVCVYSYSYGDSFANTNITITGGTFTGDVCFGGGSAKLTQENVTITGGTFNGELGRYLANDGWEDIAKP